MENPDKYSKPISQFGIKFYTKELLEANLQYKEKTVVSSITGISYVMNKFYDPNNTEIILHKVFWTPDECDPSKEYYINYRNVGKFKEAMARKKDIYSQFPDDITNEGAKNLFNEFILENYSIILPRSCFEMIGIVEAFKISYMDVSQFTVFTSQYLPLGGGAIAHRTTAVVPGILMEIDKENPSQELKDVLYFYYYADADTPDEQAKANKFDYSSDNAKVPDVLKAMIYTRDIVGNGVVARIVGEENCPRLLNDLIIEYKPPSSAIPNFQSGFSAPPASNFQQAPIYNMIKEERNWLISEDIVKLDSSVISRIEQFLSAPSHSLQDIVSILIAKIGSDDKFFNLSTKQSHLDNQIATMTLGQVPDSVHYMRLGMALNDMKEILGITQSNKLTREEINKRDDTKAVFQNIGKQIVAYYAKIKVKDEIPLTDIPYQVLMQIQPSTSYESPVYDEDDEETILSDMSNYTRFPIDPSIKSSIFGGKKNELISLTPLGSEIQERNYRLLLEKNQNPYPKPKIYEPTTPIIKEITNFEDSENWGELDKTKWADISLTKARPPRRDIALLNRRVAVDSSEIDLVETGSAFEFQEEIEEESHESSEDY